jgi:hypothetical protein
MIDGNPVRLGQDTDLYQINIQSPLVGLQKQDDAAAMDSYLQRIQQLYGSGTMGIIDNPKVITWYADKLNIPLELIQDEDKLNELVNNISETLAQNKDQLAQQQLQQLSQQPQQQAPTSKSVSQSLQELGL